MITGGKGFIGSHLAKKLSYGNNIVNIFDIKNDGLEDVRKGSVVFDATKDVDIIFHLAAIVGVEIASANPIRVIETELEGTKNILESAKENGVKRVVYASSSEVYGGSTKFPLNENDPPSPLSTYGVSKLACEHMCRAYDEEGLETIALRIFNAYGPGQDDRFVVSNFIKNAKYINSISIYNDGAQTRDFVYIDDVINAFICASEGPHGEVFNIATGRETSIRVLAEKIAGLINPRPKIEYTKPSNRKPEFEVPRRVADINKAKNALLFDCKVPLEDGLRMTILSQR